jgi:dihydrofolate reductase
MNNTVNNVVIMGKNTYFSLPNNVRPLKNRLNIVLTNNHELLLNENSNNNVIFTNYDNIYNYLISNREIINKTYTYLNENFKIFFIGGKKIYEQFIPLCNKVWVTQIKKDYFCDLFLNYDFLKDFKEPKIIDEDQELKIVLYEKMLITPFNISNIDFKPYN